MTPDELAGLHREHGLAFSGIAPTEPAAGYGRMCSGCRHTWAAHVVEYVELAGQLPRGGIVSCPEEGCWCIATWSRAES